MAKKNQLNKILTDLRIKKGFSQTQFCLVFFHKTGIELGRSRYGAYEENRSEPDIDTLKLLADVHGITMDELCFYPTV